MGGEAMGNKIIELSTNVFKDLGRKVESIHFGRVVSVMREKVTSEAHYTDIVRGVPPYQWNNVLDVLDSESLGFLDGKGSTSAAPGTEDLVLLGLDVAKLRIDAAKSESNLRHCV